MLNCLPNRVPKFVCFGEFVQTDKILGYETNKRILVRDRHAGCVRLFMSVIILLYIIVYSLGYKNLYLKFDNVFGVHRMTLFHPTKDNCDGRAKGCNADFTLVSQLPYCNQSSEDMTCESDKHHCEYVDGRAVAWTLGEQLLVTTYMEVVEQERSAECAPTKENDYQCTSMFDELQSKHFYVADIERFMIIIDHVFSAPEIHITSNAYKTAGSIAFCAPGTSDECQDEELQTFDKWEVVPTDLSRYAYTVPNGDVLSVGTLLNMAGADLDHNMSALGVTRRESGLIVVLHIEYSNTKPFNFLHSGELKYRYRVEVMETPLFRTFELRSDFKSMPSQHRVNIERRGIYIAVSRDGHIGTFSFAHLLMVFVTSFTLFGVARIVTEQLLISNVGRVFGIKGGRLNQHYIRDSTVNYKDIGSSGDVDDLMNSIFTEDVADLAEKQGCRSREVKQVVADRLKERLRTDDADVVTDLAYHIAKHYETRHEENGRAYQRLNE